MRLRPDVAVGSRQQFTLDPSSLWTVNGTIVRARVSPGTVTVGGSVAISDVIPGDGWFPAGTVVIGPWRGIQQPARDCASTTIADSRRCGS